MSATSLLPMLLPARNVRRLPERLGELIEARLHRCRIDARAIAGERQAMYPIVVAPTVDRSVLGILVDFAKDVPYYLGPGHWNDEDLGMVEDRLAETPCHAGSSNKRVVFPVQKATELLHARWLANIPLQPTLPAAGR